MDITRESVLTAINTTYILGALVAIGFLLFFIALRLQDQKEGKR
jgi:hypothetical protein